MINRTVPPLGPLPSLFQNCHCYVDGRAKVPLSNWFSSFSPPLKKRIAIPISFSHLNLTLVFLHFALLYSNPLFSHRNFALFSRVFFLFYTSLSAFSHSFLIILILSLFGRSRFQMLPFLFMKGSPHPSNHQLSVGLSIGPSFGPLVRLYKTGLS